MTIARLIDRLEELGLVKRCSDPEDRRVWRLRLTPAAAPLLSEIKRFRTKLRSVMTNGIDPAVLDAMTIGLRQIKSDATFLKHHGSRSCAEEVLHGSCERFRIHALGLSNWRETAVCDG